jgi:hypothetical protein
VSFASYLMSYGNEPDFGTFDSYTKAIEVSIRDDAVFYANRAACRSISRMVLLQADDYLRLH